LRGASYVHCYVKIREFVARESAALRPKTPIVVCKHAWFRWSECIADAG